METVVEGERSVLAALNSEAEITGLFTTAEFSNRSELKKWSKTLRDSHHELTDQEFKDLSGLESAPGILATVKIPDQMPLEKVSAERVLLLDAIQDPGNLGTIIRTAAWFGFTEILLGDGCVDHFSPKVIRASMGGFWDIHFSARLDLSICIDDLKQMGYRVLAADMNGSPFKSVDYGKLVLVLGNEASGLSEDARQMSDELVGIARCGNARNPESLNVSSAAAILMSQFSTAQ